MVAKEKIEIFCFLVVLSTIDFTSRFHWRSVLFLKDLFAFFASPIN